MKRLSLMIVLLLVMVSLTAYAGNGTQNHEKSKSHACSNVLSGATAAFSGKVIGIGNHDGLVVDTGSGPVTVYGIGPEWYWEDQGIDRPVIGDEVTVEAYAVVFSDGTRYIASSISFGGDSLLLRDAATGCPLWRGPRKH
jgi:hypothetical protein